MPVPCGGRRRGSVVNIGQLFGAGVFGLQWVGSEVSRTVVESAFGEGRVFGVFDGGGRVRGCGF